jgi:hypothetical protein
MTSWDYYITIEHTTVSFTLTRKNASKYEFVGLAIAGTSFDHVDKCKQVYQAIVSIVNDDKITDIMTKCKAAVSVTERGNVLMLIRACVQYGSKNLTDMMVKHYDLTARERLRALEWVNATGHVMVRKSMFADITGVYECGAAKVTYTIAFGDEVAPTFAYVGSNSEDMMTCIEFARELSNVCKGIITTNPELVDLSKLVRAYMWPERKEDVCAHASTPASTHVSAPNDRMFNVTYGGSVYRISTVPYLHPCDPVAPGKLKKICEQLLGQYDITGMVDCDLRTWYEIALHLGYTDVAEKMRWRRFDIIEEGLPYTVAFDRNELAWKPISANLPAQVRMCCDASVRKAKLFMDGRYHARNPDYNRIHCWVTKQRLVDMGQAEFDLLLADRVKW